MRNLGKLKIEKIKKNTFRIFQIFRPFSDFSAFFDFSDFSAFSELFKLFQLSGLSNFPDFFDFSVFSGNLDNVRQYGHFWTFLDTIFLLFRFDCVLSISRESRWRVMHDTICIVRQRQSWDFRSGISSKIVLHSRLNVGPKNLHVFISVRSTLFMPKSRSVEHLMYHCTETYATITWKKFLFS